MLDFKIKLKNAFLRLSFLFICFVTVLLTHFCLLLIPNMTFSNGKNYLISQWKLLSIICISINTIFSLRMLMNEWILEVDRYANTLKGKYKCIDQVKYLYLCIYLLSALWLTQPYLHFKCFLLQKTRNHFAKVKMKLSSYGRLVLLDTDNVTSITHCIT